MDGYDYFNSTYHDHGGQHEDYFDHHDVHRYLAPAGGVPTVDYAVIATVVLTLGMVLAIEVLRHQLDVAASGNPFFQTVLESLYRELTTLGIVEFCIYLMHKYHENFNYQMEAIFVDVHFMLFYTAVFNAIQSCLVRLLAGRKTDKSWVKMEDIDRHHYIAIRHELNRLQQFRDTKKGADANDYSNHASSHSSAADMSALDSQSTSAWKSFQESFSELAFKIRHPRLSRRKNQLLVPILFHDLVAHFQASNNLPTTFKVSPYLKRSLTSVLLDFVHISSAAWIMLMATANLLYFLSGMILSATNDVMEVEEFLIYIFFALMMVFVAFAFVLFFKMKSVFSKILKMKLTIADESDAMRKTWRRGAGSTLRSMDGSSTNLVDDKQVNLFWGSNPHFIIVATQYMQFGYALGLAMIFTYYKDFASYYKYSDKSSKLGNPNYLLLMLLVSYLIFLHLVSSFLPWYTLCTSLGQLVNKERLNETLAKMRLSEEIRNKETLEEERKFEEEIARRTREMEAKRAEAAAKASKAPKHPDPSSKDYDATESRKVSAGGLSLFQNRPSEALDALDANPGGAKDPSIAEQRKGRAGLVRTFWNRTTNTIDDGANTSQHRHSRERSLSDSVQFMRSPNIGDLNLFHSGSSSPTSSARMSVAAAQQLGSADEGEQHLDKSLFKTEIAPSSNDLDRPFHSGRERRRLTKSISDNVAFMRSMNSTAHNSPTLLELKMPVLAPAKSNAEKEHDLMKSTSYETFMSFINSTADSLHEIAPSELNMPVLEPAESNAGKENDTEHLLSVPSASRRRPRSNSLEAAAIKSIAKTNVVNGVHSGPSKPVTARARAGPGLERQARNQRRQRIKAQSEGVASMRLTLPNEAKRHSLDSPKAKKVENLPTLAELAQMPTKDLPEIPDYKPKIRPKRRPKTRSSSEGVSLMRAGLNVLANPVAGIEALSAKPAVLNAKKGAEEAPPLQEARRVVKMASIDETGAVKEEHPKPTGAFEEHTALSLGRHRQKERKERRRMMKSRSEGVASMRSSLPNEFSRPTLPSPKVEPERLPSLSELTQISTQDLPAIDSSQKARPKRRPRLRSASEGVSSMRAGLTGYASLKSGSEAPKDDIALVTAGNGTKEALPKHEAKDAMQNEEPAKSRVTFSLSNGHSLSPAEPSLHILEEDEIDSAASDDGESDIDDVPEAILSVDIREASKIDLATFFQGQRYRTISLIGPMACFFLIAMRVEIFNVYADIFKDQTNIWYKYMVQFFWIEVALYALMITELLLVLVVFLRKRGREATLRSCSAAVFGILINVMCLLLLLIAEMKRCCPDNDKDYIYTRLLGPAPSKEYNDYPAEEETECCPDFGSRRYGGLGNIEPFTCLIALSPLRFLLGGLLVKVLGRGSIHDADTHNGSHGHHTHGPDPTSKAREMWMSAIGIHGEVAKTFGLFSGELLQCMLGIYSNEIDNKESSMGDPDFSIANDEGTEHDTSQHNKRENSMDITSEASSTQGLMSPVKPLILKRYESESFGLSLDEFAYPLARLQRRMRRCERLLPGLLEEWSVVDVVLTNHELILFDVIGNNDELDSTPDMASHNNGGKNMQLCQVAKGRKVVSQFSLDDVDLVKIEHRAAAKGHIDVRDVEVNRPDLREYWQGGNHCTGEYDVDEMNKRWECVDEGRLKIHFKHHMLHLRFVADLKEMEQSKTATDDSDLMNHIGRETNIWCKNVARLRGPANLKQNLPHFGEGGADEMKDFIEICEREHEVSNYNSKNIRKTIHRRVTSFHNLRDMDI